MIGAVRFVGTGSPSRGETGGAPARELLGDMLVLLKRPAEAKAAYQATLKREPNRRHSLRGLRGAK